MPDKVNKTVSEEVLANWKVAPTLHREIKKHAVDKNLKMYELAERAWSAYKDAASPAALHAVQPEDPASARQSDYERRILAATLLFLREEKDSGESGQQLIDLLETMLKNQLARVSNDGRNKPTKKRA
jgi:hypothetical protein